MYDYESPINAPHPDLTDPARKADDPVLIYKGVLKGRWESIESAYPSYPEYLDREVEFKKRLLKGVEGKGEVSFALSPSPHISWTCRIELRPPAAEWPILISPSSISSGFATRQQANLLSGLSKRAVGLTNKNPNMASAMIGDSSSDFDEVRFYLVNFQILNLVESVNRANRTDEKAKLRLQAGDWRIVIERLPMDEFYRAIHHLENESGYAITHICRVWREDANGKHKRFSFDDVENVLDAVYLFTSFVRGGLVGIALPVGYRDGRSVFEKWDVTPVDSGEYFDKSRTPPYPGWFVWYGPGLTSSTASNSLPVLFNQFATKWWHPDSVMQKFWRNVLRELIPTYTSAERIDRVAAIASVCTALETLGWAILVKKDAWLTGNKSPGGGRSGYEKLAASDRLRLLLRWANLTTEIPASLKSLKKKTQGKDNWDGPEIVTWVRNRIVHPDKRSQLESGLSEESWLLGMWYVEVLLLRLLNYDGYYKNRLKGGEVVRFP